MDLRVKRTLNSIESSFINEVLRVGFDKVTVLKISADAQINPKTFYDHFDDKFALAVFVSNRFMEKYKQLLSGRFDMHQTSLTNGLELSSELSGAIESLLSQENLKQSWLALSQIHFENFDFKQQLLELMQTRLKDSGLTNDQLALAVIPTCAFETMNYYIQSGDQFSVDRQTNMLQLLANVLSK